MFVLHLKNVLFWFSGQNRFNTKKSLLVRSTISNFRRSERKSEISKFHFALFNSSVVVTVQCFWFFLVQLKAENLFFFSFFLLFLEFYIVFDLKWLPSTIIDFKTMRQKKKVPYSLSTNQYCCLRVWVVLKTDISITTAGGRCWIPKHCGRRVHLLY